MSVLGSKDNHDYYNVAYDQDYQYETVTTEPGCQNHSYDNLKAESQQVQPQQEKWKRYVIVLVLVVIVAVICSVITGILVYTMTVTNCDSCSAAAANCSAEQGISSWVGLVYVTILLIRNAVNEI